MCNRNNKDQLTEQLRNRLSYSDLAIPFPYGNTRLETLLESCAQAQQSLSFVTMQDCERHLPIPVKQLSVYGS